MPRINRTRPSVEDYDEIWRYIAQFDIAAADRLIIRFERNLQTLASAPLVGQSEYDLAENLRSIPVGNYLIFYRPLTDGIELIRVLHGARNITQEFFDGI